MSVVPQSTVRVPLLRTALECEPIHTRAHAQAHFDVDALLFYATVWLLQGMTISALQYQGQRVAAVEVSVSRSWMAFTK